ncbi:VOC family protein [Wenxinia saemankumensis]|uniref:Glyoxalase-like domain-containing protein n=1 Tax=Wenxinia saemankumensis TaxID=1447782 RepID=A0A1M6AQV4_9RHOB|nr:VOC family protein [Wenxinia saemankumensis]SHI38583.1 Glyoxalase-like domain-containing protein [Wenxinia saemankumensis]
MKLDHLAVVCADLDTGAAWAEDRLGVPLRAGGRHARFGTWNRLVRLGSGEYLEVIAPDPGASPPAGPRWFDLDRAPDEPRLGNWICAVPDLDAETPVAGLPLDLAREDLTWRIAVPADGGLPLQGGHPTLIEWGTGTHPAARLPDDGLSLVALEIRHPEAEALSRRLSPRLADPRIAFVPAAVPGLKARIATPAGEAIL